MSDKVVVIGGVGDVLGRAPARRVVTIDREPGRSCLVDDGPSPDLVLDPARAGFASSRLWVTDGAPAKIVVQRGTSHSWSNRSSRTAVVAIASHDGAETSREALPG